MVPNISLPFLTKINVLNNTKSSRLLKLFPVVFLWLSGCFWISTEYGVFYTLYFQIKPWSLLILYDNLPVFVAHVFDQPPQQTRHWTKLRFNAGPVSTALARHWASIGVTVSPLISLWDVPSVPMTFGVTSHANQNKRNGNAAVSVKNTLMSTRYLRSHFCRHLLTPTLCVLVLCIWKSTL